MVGHGLGLLKYFKLCSKNSCDLPQPDPLSKTVNRSTIDATVTADSLLHSSHTPCNDGYPAILIDMKSSDTAVYFKPFYRCKGFSPRYPTKRSTSHAYYSILFTHVFCIFKNLLNQGTISFPANCN